MARKIPADRFDKLVDCALQVFIDQGYRRTQMADIAEALGVAKGTLYLYVRSKEALFDLAVRYADAERPIVSPPQLPVPTPQLGATLQYVRERLIQEQGMPALALALGRRRVMHPRQEINAIVDELYETLTRNRNGIKLLDRSARDLPELAALWFEGARGGLLQLLTQYLEDRMRRKLFYALPDAATAARLLLETVVFWAVHRHWDASPQRISEAVAKETVQHFLVHSLVKRV